MGILSWIVVGLIAGFLASKIVNRTGEGFIRDILLGVVGAFIGGWIFNTFGSTGVTGLNLWSIMVAAVGGIALLLVFHAIRRVV